MDHRRLACSGDPEENKNLVFIEILTKLLDTFTSQPNILSLGHDKMSRGMKKQYQENWREFLIFDIVGNEIHLTMRGMLQTLAHLYLIVFIILTTALLVLLNAHDYLSIMSLKATIVL